MLWGMVNDNTATCVSWDSVIDITLRLHSGVRWVSCTVFLFAGSNVAGVVDREALLLTEGCYCGEYSNTPVVVLDTQIPSWSSCASITIFCIDNECSYSSMLLFKSSFRGCVFSYHS